MSEDKRKAFDAYCKTILRNEAINYHREQARRRARETPMAELPSLETEHFAETDSYDVYTNILDIMGLGIEIRDDALMFALAQSRPRQREIVLLFYFVDLTDQEIAGILSLARSTAQYRRTNILPRLKTLIEEYGA